MIWNRLKIRFIFLIMIQRNSHKISEKYFRIPEITPYILNIVIFPLASALSIYYIFDVQKKFIFILISQEIPPSSN